MALLTYILILHLLDRSFSNTCAINNTPDYINWEKELLKDLELDYIAYHPPGENTTVYINYYLETFIYRDKEEIMTMQILIDSRWKDERLKWDPEKHHGINETDATHFYLWTPYFGITNYDETLSSYFLFYDYTLKSNGDVHCQNKMIEEAWCSIKLTHWPYDLQECTFILESMEDTYMSYSSQPPLHYAVSFEFVVFEEKCSGWYMYDHKHVQENSTKNQIKLTLFLMREAEGLSAIVIWPTFVLTGLSVLSLCLDVRRKVRLAIISVSLLGHYYFLKELSSAIPRETNFPPTLLFYYRGSVILSIIIVFLTFFLDIMCKLKSTPHNYVKLINDFVYENKYRTYLVYPRWDFDDATVDSKSSSEDWVKFANIVNSVFIFIVVFAYIGMYGTNIPKPTNPHTL